MKKKMAIGLALFVVVCGIAVAAGTCISYYYRNGQSNGITVTTNSERKQTERGGFYYETNITVSSNVERRIRITSTSFGKGKGDVLAEYGSRTYTVEKPKPIKADEVTVEAQTCD